MSQQICEHTEEGISWQIEWMSESNISWPQVHPQLGGKDQLFRWFSTGETDQKKRDEDLMVSEILPNIDSSSHHHLLLLLGINV